MRLVQGPDSSILGTTRQGKVRSRLMFLTQGFTGEKLVTWDRR